MMVSDEEKVAAFVEKLNNPTSTTWEQICQRVDDEETVNDIIASLDRSAEGNWLSDEAKNVARQIHDALVTKLASASERDKLTIARAARSAFRRRQQDLTDAYLAEAVKGWKPYQQAGYYKEHPERRPTGWVPPVEPVIQSTSAPEQVEVDPDEEL